MKAIEWLLVYRYTGTDCSYMDRRTGGNSVQTSTHVTHVTDPECLRQTASTSNSSLVVLLLAAVVLLLLQHRLHLEPLRHHDETKETMAYPRAKARAAMVLLLRPRV